jgi:glutamate/tyrosine decarboxylase-like PLP-dependent enzyme
MARILHRVPSEFKSIYEGVKGLELADSITGDAHKLFNVPYDCGFFFSKHLAIATSVFQNAGAAYLATSGGPDSIPSPLNIGIENSRRFRALPLYASLHMYGVEGYYEILARQISTSRNIARVIMGHEAYELLPVSHETTADQASSQNDDILEKVYIVVLFRAKEATFNQDLVNHINKTGKIYVSGTAWDSRPAARIAVAKWQVDPHVQPEVVRSTLHLVWNEWKSKTT